METSDDPIDQVNMLGLLLGFYGSAALLSNSLAFLKQFFSDDCIVNALNHFPFDIAVVFVSSGLRPRTVQKPQPKYFTLEKQQIPLCWT